MGAELARNPWRERMVLGRALRSSAASRESLLFQELAGLALEKQRLRHSLQLWRRKSEALEKRLHLVEERMQALLSASPGGPSRASGSAVPPQEGERQIILEY